MRKGMNDNTSIQTVRLIQEIGPDTDWGTSKTRQLIAGILELKNENEAKRFLRDLMTPLEIKEFANRLEAARLLSRDMQYKGIIERTGLSSTTIARIAKWLGGSLGGYRLVLSRLSSTTLRTGSNNSSHHNNPKLRKGLSLNT